MRIIGSTEFVTSVLISFILLIVAHVVEPGVIPSRSSSAASHRKQSQSLPSQDDLSEEQAMVSSIFSFKIKIEPYLKNAIS